jgi:hypothetical protein
VQSDVQEKSMLLMKRIVMLFCAIFLLNALIACEPQEGPAEKAGKKIDETVEKTGKKNRGGGRQNQKRDSELTPTHAYIRRACDYQSSLWFVINYCDTLAKPNRGSRCISQFER